MDKLWKKFNALGTEVIVVAILKKDQADLLNKVEAEFIDFEKRFSRFIKGNELQELNDFSGQKYQASPMMIELLKLSQVAFKLTGGIFDPTIIGSLEEVGYDKRFNDIKMSASQPATVKPEKIKQQFLKRAHFSDLIIDGNELIKPAGLRIDFGGIGKGYIADHLSQNLFANVADAWISAGGDLAVKGNDIDMNGWTIGVQNPHAPDQKTFSITTQGKKCGIATSGIFKRKGEKGGFSWHHLIDPRNGLPVENNVLAVTAVATGAQLADVYAKTVLILGEKDGLDFIDSRDDSAAAIFLKNGGVIFSKKAVEFFKI